MRSEEEIKNVDRSAVLHVAGLNVARGKTQLLRDLNWSVRPGEHWAVLGPNGCGKSTLLAALGGYISATSGQISVLGELYGDCDWRSVLRKLGFVGAGVPRFIESETTAFETVVAGCRAELNPWKPFSAAERRRAREVMKQLGIAELETREWWQLSEGERQRVVIARALMADPALLILDEPCAGLDPVARAAFLKFLKERVQVRAPSVILVTHHVEEIVEGFTHALVLTRGRVVAAGPIRESLTSATLSDAFAAPLALAGQPGTFRLKIG